MDKRDGLVLGRIIARKFDFDEVVAESIARDMIMDDFPANGIKTMGAAIAYIERLDRRAEQG
jgi:hypothetical protein